MTRIEALKELAAKVEAGRLDECRYTTARFEDAGFDKWAELAYHGSLDAAKALHEAVLPGWKPRMPAAPWNEKSFAVEGPTLVDDPEGDCSGFPSFVGKSDTPARAWLLAILRALIAQEKAAHTPPCNDGE
jgi:hypothetical protein